MEVDGGKSVGKSVPKWVDSVASSPRDIEKATLRICMSIRWTQLHIHSMALGGAHFGRSL